MANDFPLCKQLGLEVYKVLDKDNKFLKWPQEYVRASDLERILAAGVRVSAYMDVNSTGVWSESDGPGATHTALLINVQPIVRESAEDVLRDWLNWQDGVDRDVSVFKLKERARRVLGEK